MKLVKRRSKIPKHAGVVFVLDKDRECFVAKFYAHGLVSTAEAEANATAFINSMRLREQTSLRYTDEQST